MEQCPLCGHNTFDGEFCHYCKLDLSKQIGKNPPKLEIRGITVEGRETCPFCLKKVEDNFDADKVKIHVKPHDIFVKFHKSCASKGK